MKLDYKVKELTVYQYLIKKFVFKSKSEHSNELIKAEASILKNAMKQHAI